MAAARLPGTRASHACADLIERAGQACLEGEVAHHDEQGYHNQCVGACLGGGYLPQHTDGGGGVEDGGVSDEADYEQRETDIHAQEYQYQEDDDAYDAYDCGIHRIPFLPHRPQGGPLTVTPGATHSGGARPGGMPPGLAPPMDSLRSLVGLEDGERVRHVGRRHRNRAAPPWSATWRRPRRPRPRRPLWRRRWG